MVNEAAIERRREMNLHWEHANYDPNHKPLSPSEARTNRREIPIRQHCIPRFWLVGFSDSKDKAGKVSSMDLAGTDRPIKISTKSAATEEHFYTLTGQDGQPCSAIEDKLWLDRKQCSISFQKDGEGET